MHDDNIKYAKSYAKWFVKVEDIFKEYGKALREYISHMQEQVKLCDENYLFAFQNALFKDYSNETGERNTQDNIQILQDKIYGIFANVVDNFKIERCFLFMPDLSKGTYATNEPYKTIEINGNNKPNKPISQERQNIVLDIGKLPNIESGYIRFNNSTNYDFIKGYFPNSTGDNVMMYCNDFNETNKKNNGHFFGVLLEWDSAKWFTNGNGESCRSFFASLR